MADPLSFSASMAALLRASQELVQYIRSCKDANKDLKSLQLELINVRGLLYNLRDLLPDKESTDESVLPVFQSLAGRDGPLEQFQTILEELVSPLQKRDPLKKAGKVLAWHFKKDTIKELLSKIERYKALFSLVLQSDQIGLTQLIANDIEHLKQDFLQTRDTADDLRKGREDDERKSILRWLSSVDFLSNHDAACAKHEPTTGNWFLQSSDFDRWKTEANGFVWLHGFSGSGKIVLCSTIIQRTMLFLESDPTSALAFFYFDFRDQQKQEVPDFLRSLIARLCKGQQQLPESIKALYERYSDQEAPSSVQVLLKAFTSVIETPGQKYVIVDALDECTDRGELLEVLTEIAAVQLSNAGKLHILVTSRQDRDILQGLKGIATQTISLGGSKIDDDIAVHIHSQIEKQPKLRRWPDQVKSEIERKLVERANGMFRWLFCQLNTLKLCRKESTLRESIEQLPRDLDETYDRILQNIEQEDSKEAFAALQWLAYSERPLSLNKLAEAVVLGPERCAIHDRDRLLDPYQVLHICSSLVVLGNEDSQSELEEGDYVDDSGEEGKFVTFAHFSVKEYITSERFRIGPLSRFHVSLADSHAFIAKTCLSYLLNLDSADSWPEGKSRTHILREYPLVEYAAIYWPAHLSTLKGHTDHEDDVTVLASTLLGPESWAFFNWLRIHDPVRSICFSEKGAMDSEEGSTGVWFYDEFYPPPLYYASRLKLPGLAQSLLDKGADVNRIGGDVHTALHAACAADYIMPSHVAGDPSLETMKVLLDRGAEVDIKNDENCTPLYECIFREKWSEARLLVERGANVNLMSDWGCTPLNTAIRRSHEDMVRLLVDKGADVEAVRSVIEGGGTVLHTVLNELDKMEEYSLPFDDVYQRITEFLLEHGANVDADKQNGCTVLHGAARQANEAMVQLLLGKGAAIDAKSGDGQTALHMVAHLWHDLAVEELWIRREHPRSHSVQKRHRHERIAQLMLDWGAEIDAADHRGETALHETAKCGNKAVVRILVKRGAAIDKINFEGQTALHLAALYGPTEHLESRFRSATDAGEESSDGRAETIDLLEEKATDAEGECSDDRAEIIELLPDEATDADEESHNTRAARNSIVVSKEYAETVELLLEGKVDIEAKDVDGQTALYLAAKRGHKKIVKMLLERGADIEAKDDNELTALHLAAKRGHKKIVKMLLERGADIEARDDNELTALRFAASEYYAQTTVELILKEGADIEEKDLHRRTALHFAHLEYYKQTPVELFLKKGADIEAKDAHGRTALHLAALRGFEKTVDMLLANRADRKVKTSDGQTALDLAILGGRQEVKQLLLKEKVDGD